MLNVKANQIFLMHKNINYMRVYGLNNSLKFYFLWLTTSIYDAIGRKEGNILFNDALKIFYLHLCGIRHMVKDHSYSERRNPRLPLHGLSFLISIKGSFICIIPDRITHTTAFITPVMEHWLEREIAQWVHHEELIWWPIAQWLNTLSTELHLTSDTICYKSLYWGTVYCRGQNMGQFSFYLNTVLRSLIFDDLQYIGIWNIFNRNNPVAHWNQTRRKEGNVLFNDTLNTFFLWLYGKRPFK